MVAHRHGTDICMLSGSGLFDTSRFVCTGFVCYRCEPKVLVGGKISRLMRYSSSISIIAH